MTDNLDKVKPILTTVAFAYQSLIQKDYELFFGYMNQGWQQKKDTVVQYVRTKQLKEIDSTLENNPSVLSHKLCGAGNGGFFLVFSDKGNLNIPYESVKINVSPNGVMGRCL